MFDLNRWKKLLGKGMLTRAMAVLLLALLLCISACDGSGTGIDTTAADTTSPLTQQTTVADSTEDTTAPDSVGTIQESTAAPEPETPTEGTTAPDSVGTTCESTAAPEPETPTEAETEEPDDAIDVSEIPAYSGSAYVALNNNIPYFSEAEKTTESYETYGALDALGRCTQVIACCGKDLMPTGDRGNISSIKPTGWVQAQYSVVSGGNLYNRCHLIGWQITGEDANARNLLTGTRYFNENMIPFENMIADYIKETGNHVMYRVTPVFTGDNLLADGIVMEAWSVEDGGEGVCFCVFMYNVQPGVVLDYATGESYLEADGGPTTPGEETTYPEEEGLLYYVLNISSKKIHKTTCRHVATISEKNRRDIAWTLEEVLALFDQEYTNCGTCKGHN